MVNVAQDKKLRDSAKPTLRERRGEILFIDARKWGYMVNLTQQDVPGFCKSATLEEIRGHNHVLTLGG